MEKNIKTIAIIALVLSILNTFLLCGLIGDRVYAYNKSKPIVISKQLDKGQSMELALKTEKPIIAWFYTDWCRYCQIFSPTFKKLMKNKELKKLYAFAFINAENPANQIYVDAYNVEGFPTVYLIKDGKTELLDQRSLFAPNAEEKLIDIMKKFLD